MAVVHPFRAVRYNLAKVGDLSRVVTQPYDRIGPKEMEGYLARSPSSYARLIGGKNPPGDDGDYLRRAELLRSWLEQGVLLREDKPGFCLYRVTFTHEGRRSIRQGVIGLLDLEKSGAKAHERTLRGPKEDRMKLFRATEAHLEQIFLLYRDPQRRVTRVLESAVGSRKPDLEAHDDFANLHQVWLVSDSQAVRQVQEAFEAQELYIADGHHRFETAKAFMQECLTKGWKALGPESFTSLPVTLVNVAEPGCVIRPTPRVLHSLPGFDLQSFLGRVSQHFGVESVGSLEQAKVRLAEGWKKEHVFALYSRGKFWALVLKSEGDVDRLVPGPQPLAWKKLDVAILHKALLERYLGIDEEALAKQTYLEYAHTAEEAVELVDKGQGQAAFLLNPTQVEEVLAIADLGETMPQKSTDFYPKLLSGLVAMKMEINKG